MQLTVESIGSSGGFTGGPVKRQVSWEVGGEEFTADVWIRPMSYHTAVNDITAINSGRDVVAHRLAHCVCHEDGSPVFRVSDITGIDEEGRPVMVLNDDGEEVERGALDSNLANALMILVSEVSGLGKKKSRLPRKKSSGTS